VLRKDIKKAAFQATAGVKSTADPVEIARFEQLADEWWKPDGAFKVVHAFNQARVRHLTQRDGTAALPLAGLNLLDVGCGAGIVTEPISRLGAKTLGIDAAERNVLVAARHASLTSAPVTYRHALPEDLVAAGQRFDIVLSLEVVEHVASVPVFLAALAKLVAPGGVLVIGTLNRTAVSFVKAIVGAEYVLGWMPRGTHDWRKFVTPAELDGHLAPHGFAVIERCGVELNPLTMRWRISNTVPTTYLQFHRAAG
jgi:2-polyprenyl-6-hydroxyphenyl methylase / 3-demethylubiquinone-9 3-methyltransferase